MKANIYWVLLLAAHSITILSYYTNLGWHCNGWISSCT